MTRLEPAHRIEKIVGAKRHPTDHLARAVSAEQRVYILHSAECAAPWHRDLRDCEYSLALDLGIDLHIWHDFRDQVVTLAIDADTGELLPTIGADTPTTKGTTP